MSIRQPELGELIERVGATRSPSASDRELLTEYGDSSQHALMIDDQVGGDVQAEQAETEDFTRTSTRG